MNAYIRQVFIPCDHSERSWTPPFTCVNSDTHVYISYHIKSRHNEQNVGWRSMVAINLCPFTWWTRRRIAPRRRLSRPSFSLNTLCSFGGSETWKTNKASFHSSLINTKASEISFLMQSITYSSSLSWLGQVTFPFWKQ